MSNYTTQVRFICESCAGLEESGGYKTVNEVICLARPKIFDFEYPIFDPKYKSVLESKILKHYYTREICEETVGLWKLRLDARLNEIMPYYNQLYKSEQITFNPMIDFELSKQYDKNGTQDGSESNNGTEQENRTNSKTINESGETSNNKQITETEEKNINNTDNKSVSANYVDNKDVELTGDTLNKFSDTPQGGLTDLQNGTYLTNATHNINNNNEKSTNNSQYEEEASNENNGTENIEKTHTDTTTEQVEKTQTNTTTEQFEKTLTDTKENQVTTTEKYIEKICGKQSVASYSQLLNEYRTTFLNIDTMVIADLDDLFFGLW